jgi:hypothetical protein
VFRPMVQVAVLTVFHTGQDLPRGRPVAVPLIRADDPWNGLASCEKLAEQRLGGRLMTASLHEDIQHTAVLIHRPPQIRASALNREKHLIEMPFVTWSGTPAPELIGIRLPTRAAPLADGFVGGHDPACQEQRFDIAITQAEAAGQPDPMADHLGRGAGVLVVVGRHDRVHAASMPYRSEPVQVINKLTTPHRWA